METRWIRLFDEEQKPRKFSVMWEEFLSPYGTAESVPPGVPVEFIGEPTANLSFNLLLIRLSTVDAHPVIRTVLPAGMERMWLGINDYINTINACYDGTRARIVYVLGSTSEKSIGTISSSTPMRAATRLASSMSAPTNRACPASAGSMNSWGGK